ncbi:hypothetical protein SAMN05444166_4035 [Singulisphaera sp. GP187]|uniref:hypothetical protein n=1 Tax=Singulisphaera sp. GP187 TaxID=1882752 RepID=UPI000927A7F4|nr:hypothetical protein [Singulisphaera sp. GP187]SIO35439.1 hypothetical protein SAMN05444166_4035 [Singulisphaera sp. GP187]
MSLPPLNGSVYWIEADEEARLYATGPHDALCRRSFLSYVLLRLKVVAHPADFWQSSVSHKLVFNPQAQPLLQPVLQIHLGDSTTVVDYIADRTEKLSRDRASSRSSARELEQYTQHGEQISAQGAQLDGLFTNNGSIFPATVSRDARFRELVIKDLSINLPFGNHLERCIRDGLGRSQADTFVGQIRDLAHNRRRFISVDGIVSRLSSAGCAEPAVKRAYNRLQLLHWESRSNGLVSMPFVERARNGRINPHDPDVFWSSVDGLLGPDFQAVLMNLPWPKALDIVCDLQNDAIWASFIETYHGIVSVVDQNYERIEESIVRSRVLKQHPKFTGILLEVRPDKWTILSWTCHIASWYVSVPTGWGLAWRIGSGVSTIKKMHDHVIKVTKTYHASERHVLQTRILRVIEEAKKP